MSNVIPLRERTDAEKWPGYAKVDRTGAALAQYMLVELGSADSSEEDNEDAPCIAECSMLEDWARRGRPFRNVVAKYAAQAQALGPHALEGFYAVLSDYLAVACQGCIPDADTYDRYCEPMPAI